MTGLEEWWDDLRGIRAATELHGIEKLFDWVIYFLMIFTPLKPVQFLWGRRDQGPPQLPDWYVVGVTIVLIFLLYSLPQCSFWIACYLLTSLIVVLLNVLFLTKHFGPVLSYERSLLLFMLNVGQVVLIFAIFYRWNLPSLDACNALFYTLLVFGTIGYHSDAAKTIVGFQIGIDFLLLAVFLAHFVGRLGTTREEAKP